MWKKFRWRHLLFSMTTAAMVAAVHIYKQQSEQALPTTEFSLAVDVPLVRAEQFPYRWQTVNSTVGLHVFSAFLDDRDTTKVLRVVGLGSRSEFKDTKPAVCLLWDLPTSTTPRVRNGLVVPLKVDATSLTHMNVECNMTDEERPFAVSVSLNMTSSLNNWIPLKYPREVREFTVCFPAINTRYNDAKQMVQTIEFNRLLGAQKFVIYNMSVLPAIQKIMEHYQNQGILKVLDWTGTRRWHDGMIHYWAQETSMFDCLFRNVHESKWVIFADLDEVIIPRNHSTWSDLLRHLNTLEPLDNVGSLMFLHALFSRGGQDDLNTSYSQEASRLGVVSLLKTQRLETIGSHGQRSKQMVRPEAVRMVGVHLTHIHLPGFKTRVVPRPLGLLHHYSAMKAQSTVRDTNAGRFHKALLQRVSGVWNQLGKK